MWFELLYNVCPKHFSFWEELSEIRSKTCIGLHIKYPLFLPDFNETWIFLTYFEKYSNIKYYENPSSGNRVFPCGRTDGQTDRQTDRHDEANSRVPQFCELAWKCMINPLNAELNPICHLLALLGAHHILHVSSVRVKMDDVRSLECSCTVQISAFHSSVTERNYRTVQGITELHVNNLITTHLCLIQNSFSVVWTVQVRYYVVKWDVIINRTSFLFTSEYATF